MTRGRRVQLSLEELKQRINDYFLECDEKQQPYTVEFLALSLGVNRSTLLRWENEQISFVGMDEDEIEEFCNTIKMAKAKCEAYAARELFSSKNPAGIIFSLKNNYNWQDKQEIVSTNTNYNANNNLLKDMSKQDLLQLVEKLQLNSSNSKDKE